jgi:hypothetical protein
LKRFSNIQCPHLLKLIFGILAINSGQENHTCKITCKKPVLAVLRRPSTVSKLLGVLDDRSVSR